MNLLLINSPIDKPSILGEFRSMYDDLKMVPTGLAYLASSAMKSGIDVSIIDQFAEECSFEMIEDRIRKFAPDLIGFGATTPNYATALEFLKQVRKAFPLIKTVMGGNHPSIFPDLVLSHPEVDFVLRGEAEISLPELCASLSRGENRPAIRGLSFRDERGEIRHNPPAGVVDVAKLPWPAYHLLPMHLYSSPRYTKFAQPIFQMVASRGCPHHCSYCINAIEPKAGATYRQRPLDDVIDEMAMLAKEFSARQIQFWDPIFPMNKTQALEFCRKVRARGLHRELVWNSTTCPDFLDEEIIQAMVGAGCRGIGFGIESGVPELLRQVNKKINLPNVRKVCRIARRAGLVVAAGFILGFPGETPEMTRRTIRFAKSLDLHFAQFNIMIPYPGTPLFHELVARGELRLPVESEFLYYNQSIGLTPHQLIYVPRGRTSEELKMWQKRAYQEFYLRAKMVLFHLSHVRPQNIFQSVTSLLAIIRLTFSRLLGLTSRRQTPAVKEKD